MSTITLFFYLFEQILGDMQLDAIANVTNYIVLLIVVCRSLAKSESTR